MRWLRLMDGVIAYYRHALSILSSVGEKKERSQNIFTPEPATCVKAAGRKEMEASFIFLGDSDRSDASGCERKMMPEERKCCSRSESRITDQKERKSTQPPPVGGRGRSTRVLPACSLPAYT